MCVWMSTVRGIVMGGRWVRWGRWLRWVVGGKSRAVGQRGRMALGKECKTS